MKTRNSPVLSNTVEYIRKLIESSTETCLSSVRSLSIQCNASPVTVLRAIEVLKNEGLLERRWGRRYYIAGKNNLSKPQFTNTRPRQNTIEKTLRLIKNDILEGKYESHLPLPSITQLMAHYNVSYPSVKKALIALCDQKIIKRSGARYYFFTNRIKSSFKIAIVAFGLERNAAKIETERERTFYRLLSTAAMNCNVQLQIICCNDYLKSPFFFTPDDSSLASYFKRAQIEGIILSSYHMKDSAEILRKLLQYNLPVSAWVEDSRILKMSERYGTQDTRLSFFDSSYSLLPGYDVGRYLIEKGHKNIAYISPFHGSPWSQNRLSGLKKAAASYPEINIHPFVQTEYINDYAFMEKVLNESRFDQNCSISKIEKEVHPFLSSRISFIRYEHDILLRDSMVFTICLKLIEKALVNRLITAWVCANDAVAVLISDYWNYCKVPLAKRPALVGFDNSFESIQRNISSYEFNTYGEVQHMLNHLLYPNSSIFLKTKPAIRLSGRVIERASTNIAQVRPL